MAQKQWANVRIRQSTRERLQALIATLSGDADGGWKPELRHDGCYISLDEAITVLLDRNDAHKIRGKQARKRKQKGRLLDLQETLPSEV